MSTINYAEFSIINSCISNFILDWLVIWWWKPNLISADSRYHVLWSSIYELYQPKSFLKKFCRTQSRDLTMRTSRISRVCMQNTSWQSSLLQEHNANRRHALPLLMNHPYHWQVTIMKPAKQTNPAQPPTTECLLFLMTCSPIKKDEGCFPRLLFIS